LYFNPKNSEYQTCLLQFNGMQITLLDEKGELVFGFLKKDVILDSDSESSDDESEPSDDE